MNLEEFYEKKSILFCLRPGIAQSIRRLPTGWEVRGSNPGGGEIFRTRPDWPLGPTSLLYKWYRVSFLGVTWPGRGDDLSPSSESSWPLLRRTLPFPLSLYLVLFTSNSLFFLTYMNFYPPSFQLYTISPLKLHIVIHLFSFCTFVSFFLSLRNLFCHSIFILSTAYIRRSQWPRGLRLESVASRMLGLRVRIPHESWTSFCFQLCVLSGRGLCVGVTTFAEESYWVWS